jgi:hypothetical protein
VFPLEQRIEVGMVELQARGLWIATAVTLGVISPIDGLAALRPQAAGPSIELWTSGEVLRRGDRAHVWFRTDADAYVTVLRIDTDGRVRVLYPYRPWQANTVRAGHRTEVLDAGGARGSYAFVVDDEPGQGFVFAIASHHPFDYGHLVRGDHWDYHSVGYRGYVTGDPYVAVTEFIDLIAYDPYAVSYDVYPYYVDRRFDYPRFLCYGCHEQVEYRAWNPYRHSCVRFRIVVYDDPHYYPARSYPGTRVVFSRPQRIEPRYVFKDRTASAAYVTRTRRRPEEPSVRASVARAAITERTRPPAVRPQAVVERTGRRTVESIRRLLQPTRRTAVSEARLRAVGRTAPPVRVKPKLERRAPSSNTAKAPARRVTPKAKPVPARRKPAVKPKPAGNR